MNVNGEYFTCDKKNWAKQIFDFRLPLLIIQQVVHNYQIYVET